MDRCAGKHGVIVTLFLTLKLGLWQCWESELSFSPIIVEIHNDSLHQRLLVEWNNINKITYQSDMDLTFHIQVARSEKKIIIADEYLAPDLSRRHVTFRWTWDSQLPLECDSHSVRIRSIAVGDILERTWSEWSPWKTHPGENKGRAKTKIYPHERVVPEGSDVTFCCLPGHGQTVQEMMYDREKKKREFHKGTDSYVISLRNVKITSQDGRNVRCLVDKRRKGDIPPGTVLLVTRLPDEPKDFSCVTQDLQTLRCRWSPGAMQNFNGILEVKYTLREWFSGKSISCSRDHCDWPIQENQQTYNLTLTARNQIGEKSIDDVMYLNQRVLLVAPSDLRADYVNASSVTLTWYLKEDYTSLRIHCQVDLQKNPEHELNMTSGGKRPMYMYGVVLSELQPYTHYNLRVRCMAESSLAGWSDWSDLVVRTSEDVPTGALDVWRHIEDVDKGRTVTLYWRPSPLFRANGNLSYYNIKYWPLEGAPSESEVSVSGVNSSQIYVGRQAYSISVTAHNRAGRSPPAELRIPASAGNDNEQMVANRIYGKNGGIYISWQQNLDVHGYVVEWCAEPRSPYCDLRWKKYNATVESDIIRSRVFSPGVRYDFRIYGSMKDGEHLLEKMTGYIVEEVSSVKPTVKISKIEPSSIFLDWSPYPTGSSQKGFIIGYNIYVRDIESDCSLCAADKCEERDNLNMCKFYIGDPNKMQMTINELKPNGKYKVAVVAITGGGEPRAEFQKVNTPSDPGAAIRSIIVPIITVSALALVLLFIGCWKRAWIKRICLPDIPDPNKSKIFSFNGTKGTLNGNFLPTINHESQMVDMVSVQENKQRKAPEEPNVSPEHQLHEMYTKVQTREGNECDEDVSESYIPYDNDESLYSQMNDPSYKSQPLPYLQFLNQTYTGTLDDISDNAQGYRPQTNIAQVHCPPYAGTSVKSESGHDDEPDICFSGPDYGSEPMSPVSVGSTALIIVD